MTKMRTGQTERYRRVLVHKSSVPPNRLLRGLQAQYGLSCGVQFWLGFPQTRVPFQRQSRGTERRFLTKNPSRLAEGGFIIHVSHGLRNRASSYCQFGPAPTEVR